MKTILLSFLFSLTLNFGFSQCPNTATIVAGSKCFNLSWVTPPSPLPGSISYLGDPFNFLSGAGTSMTPAVYREGANNCQGSTSPFNGTIIVGGLTCNYNVDGILPIYILSLKANLGGRNLKVDFNIDNDETDVVISLSASTDGEEWTNLPWSKVINTEDFKFVYSLDMQLSALENYEYIKVQGIKLDGRTSFSRVISIEKGDSKAFDIYPNPSQNGIYNLTCASCADKSAEIEVYSPEGRRISTNTASTSVYSLDLSKATNGVYIVKIIQGGETTTKRVVKMN